MRAPRPFSCTKGQLAGERKPVVSAASSGVSGRAVSCRRAGPVAPLALHAAAATDAIAALGSTTAQKRLRVATGSRDRSNVR